jgi:transposase
MNPFPQKQSILIIDNCNTHKSKAVREAVEAAGRYNIIDTLVMLTAQSGCVLMFLPAYSPDLNPIEESFSAGMSSN